MDYLKHLNQHFLDPLLISFNDEVCALESNTTNPSHSVDDKFFSSLHKDELSSTTSGASNSIKQSNDFVFDKTHVNPFFIRQNTTETLINTLDNEKRVVRPDGSSDDDDSDGFSEARKKVKNYISLQRSHREEERLKAFKLAITEYRWLYQPKLISPFPKNFLQDCMITEYVLAKFVETVLSNGTKVPTENRTSFSDCIFGMTLKTFFNDDQKHQYFNRLFLPGVYAFPKQLNTAYVFNKYMNQFFPDNVEIANGTDTMHSLFFNTTKFNNIDGAQTVSNFIKSFSNTTFLDGEIDETDIEMTIRRLENTQKLTVLYLIMKSRLPNLKLKTAERGKVSSTTSEFILKENTMYYYERVNLWCVYFQNETRPIYSYNILDMFYYIIKNTLI